MTMGPYIYPTGIYSCGCSNCPGRNQWYTLTTTTSFYYTPKHRKPGPAR